MVKTRTVNTAFCLIILTAVLGVTGLAADNTKGPAVLVVPARHTIIKLAFDIAALRDVALVAYDKVPDIEGPFLHVWNADTPAWDRLTLDEYNVGAFCDKVPNEMILVGYRADLPATVIAGASQANKVTRIDTLNLVTIVNTLDKSMKFTPSEWKVLAKRHRLEIKDMNYERRRWGRYGPRKKAEVEPTEEDTDVDPEAMAEANKLSAKQEVEQLRRLEATIPELSPEPAEAVLPAEAPEAVIEEKGVEKATAAEVPAADASGTETAAEGAETTDQPSMAAEDK
jgi:hypothetical protein